MINYPWRDTFDEMLRFEATHFEWVCDVPQLSAIEVSGLVRKCLIENALPATALLSHAVDQQALSDGDAIKAFEYMQQLHFNLRACFAAMALAKTLPTEQLIWIAEEFGQREDAYVHAISNLVQRCANDDLAKTFMDSELPRISDSEIKNWVLDRLGK